MNKEEYKFSDLTGKIIGCAMQVHKVLGSGFQEVIYQRALAIEMTKKDLSFHRELEMPIYYDEQQIGTRRVDFLVEDKIMVEIKALSGLEDVHLAQAINYLEAYKLEIGLLINFGTRSLEVKRVINSQNRRLNDFADQHSPFVNQHKPVVQTKITECIADQKICVISKSAPIICSDD